jgi:transcriptional regulator with XRE-family HTH domain
MVAHLRLEAVHEDGLVFGAMLRRFRMRAGLSQNQLARRAGCDAAYVNRLERELVHGGTPSRRLVEAFAEAVDGSAADGERLLVAAGHCPSVIREAGGWDRYLYSMRAMLAEALEGADRVLAGADAEARTIRDPSDGARGR